MNYQKHDVPNEYLEKWQKTVNLLAKIFEVPAGLIMRVWPDQLEVLVSSKSEGNPFEPYEKADLNTGIYCETVMKTQSQLVVPAATQDEEWKNNPAIDLNMTFYLGIPLIWPDDQIFGTICVLDSKTRSFSKNYQELMWEFKKSIESDFKLIEQNKELHFQISVRKQTEEALRESEARWRSLTETSPDHILTLDENLNIQFANFASPGLTVNELIGTPLFQYIEGEKKQNEVKAILESVLRTGELKSYETVYNTPDSGIIYYESQVSPRVLEASKGTIGLTVSARNITERKQMEEELRETKAILQAALDNSPVGIAIAKAPDGKLMYVNDAGLSIPAGSKKELIRDIDIEKYASNWQVMHFDGTEYQGNELPLARAIMYGESCWDEFIIRGHDGEDHIVVATAAPIFDDKGTVKHGIVVFHDITDRNQAEEQVKAS
ncbi:MAG: PAS domain S-box protein, partial [Deltaproteobacteria bacterium]|nr:PAS domain S-box protein [Deltaproteobacteria bacterium]